jgi:hypothetical protein
VSRLQAVSGLALLRSRAGYLEIAVNLPKGAGGQPGSTFPGVPQLLHFRTKHHADVMTFASDISQAS